LKKRYEVKISGCFFSNINENFRFSCFVHNTQKEMKHGKNTAISDFAKKTTAKAIK